MAPDRLSVPLDRLAAAGDPQLRRILLYARRRRDPFTAAEAAADLAVHRNVARGRLDRLVEAGFLAVSLERRGRRGGPGAGRPAKVYRVAPEVEGVEFPDRRMGDLIGLLVEKVPARARSRALREVGEDFGRELAEAAGLAPARSVRRGLERLCDALGLLSSELSSGWGIRTMSSGDAGFNPLAYHNGTVWPHDTAFVAEGIRRSGHREEASRVALAVLEAADAFDGRLPELFAGFERSETGFPVEYDGASRPQSFAAGAPLLALRTLLGLDGRDGAMVSEPCLPDGIPPIALAP